MKLTRFSILVGGLFTLLLGAVVFSPTSANAQCPPGSAPGAHCGDTVGTAGGGTGTGNASVFNLADLKTDGPNGPLLCSGAPAVCNYDDDPAPNADSRFNVVPNLDDAPLQWANKYVFINNPSGVLQVQKTISSVNANGGDPYTVVYDDIQPGANILTGAACLSLLGADGTAGTVANGLISTGQKSAAELQSIRNGCQQNTVGVLVNPFPVSKHLPPGIYRQCAVLAQSGGTASPTYCDFFRVLPITGFDTDVNTVNYGNLVQGVKSIFGGDFVLDGGAGANPGTIVGIGNTSPKLLVAYSCMYNDFNGTPTQLTDDKLICNYFDIQVNRQDSGGNIIATQHLDGIPGGGHPRGPNPFGPDADTTTGVSTGASPFVPICLEPNENLKLDFSVTPQEVLYPGSYAGLVRLTVSTTDLPGNCTPTLGSGESAEGDADGLYNNLPGGLIAQDYPAAP